MKKMFRNMVLFVTSLVVLICATYLTAYASGSLNVGGMEIDDYSIRLLVSGDMPENLSTRISGIDSPMVMQSVADTDIVVRTIFLVDTSASICYVSRQQILDTLDTLIEHKDHSEQFAIISFGEEYLNIRMLTYDRFNLIRALDELVWRGERSDIVDSMGTAIMQINSNRPEYRVFNQLVVFSDGVDSATAGITRDELLFTLINEYIPVHTIGFRNEYNADSLNDFYTFARITGGVIYELEPDSGIENLVDTIASFGPNSSFLTIEIPEQLRDGTVRPLELVNSAGVSLLTYNLNMPLVEVPMPEPPPPPPPPPTPPPPPPPPPTEPEPIEEPTVGFFRNNIILIVIVVVVLLAGAAAAVLMIKRQRERLAMEAASVVEEVLPDDNKTVLFFDEGNITRSLIGETPTNKAKSFFLTINDIAQPHKRFEIKVEDAIEIGRGPNKPGITIDYDEKISRRHCVVELRDGSLWIKDLGSVNSTHVNDELLAWDQELKSNDVLTLGNKKFFVRIDER